jgi:hypothetical protein
MIGAGRAQRHTREPGFSAVPACDCVKPSRHVKVFKRPPASPLRRDRPSSGRGHRAREREIRGPLARLIGVGSANAAVTRAGRAKRRSCGRRFPGSKTPAVRLPLYGAAPQPSPGVPVQAQWRPPPCSPVRPPGQTPGIPPPRHPQLWPGAWTEWRHCVAALPRFNDSRWHPDRRCACRNLRPVSRLVVTSANCGTNC